MKKLIPFLLFILFSACHNPSFKHAENEIASQDSLIALIDKEIANQNAQKAKLEHFEKRQLPKNFEEKLSNYYPIIRKYSKQYDIDWRLTTAQILKESLFKENARSHVGAMGLMQIMPRTAKEIEREMDISFISKDPLGNIGAGVYYMSKQLKKFPSADDENRLKLALAAYNAGVARVLDAQSIARAKNLDPYDWKNVRECIQLLTDDDWQLHLEVWEQGKPRFGYFYGYEETVDYVDDIFKKFAYLKKMYPAEVEIISLADLSMTM